MKFLLFVFLGMAAIVSHGAEGDSSYVAVVRQFPSVLIKCNVFFVSKEYLVGTAACFLCNHNCSFQVVVGKTEMCQEDNDVYDVSEVILHPKYVEGTGSMYNIAVIKLQKPASNAVVLQLANETNNEWGQVSSWAFSADLKRYRLQPNPFRRLSAAICKEGNVVVGSDEYCASTVEGKPVAFGAENEGVPHVLGIGNNKGNDSPPVVLGFRSKIDNDAPETYFAFTSIPQYHAWIMTVISSNIHPNGCSCTATCVC